MSKSGETVNCGTNVFNDSFETKMIGTTIEKSYNRLIGASSKLKFVYYC